MLRRCTRLSAAVALVLAGTCPAQGPLTAAFTYQGELRASGNPATGLYDLRFRLYDAPTGGTQLGSTLCADNVSLSNGRFAISLDFGSQFAGQQRFLEIDVRQDTGLDCSNSAGFTTLAPRQPLTAAPYAEYALATATAATASNATQLNGQSASYYTNAANLTGTLPTSVVGGAYPGITGLGTVTSGTWQGSTIDAFHGGTGLTSVANGDLLVGSGTGTLSRLPISGSTTSSVLKGGSSPTWGALSGADLAAPLVMTGSIDSEGVIQGVSGDSTNGSSGVHGRTTAATGVVYGVLGESAGDTGYGVCGLATSASGTGTGGYFSASSPSGTGVRGLGQQSGGHFTSNSAAGIGLWAEMTASGAGTSGFGVRATCGGASGIGVYGAGAYGVKGETLASGGIAVDGLASASSGNSIGVRGENSSASGVGVLGIDFATTGLNFGVSGATSSNAGIAVEGYASSATGVTYGVIGESVSTSGLGVYGLANASSGGTYGGYFESVSTGGTGMYGYAAAGSGPTSGVYGRCDSSTGIGVYGYAPQGGAVGTFGGYFTSVGSAGQGAHCVNTASSGTTYGVVGEVLSPSGYGVYSLGRFAATGTKAFRIDHPLDPENKYLLHYCHEGPEPQNVYNGNATLDGRGEATIELPPYFAAINKDPRYTLTAIGAPMPMLHIAREIDAAALEAGAKLDPGQTPPECAFLIAGGVPGGKVTWEVKAVRNDRWMQQNGAPVEQPKPEGDRGTYQHPELYGQPARATINPLPDPRRSGPHVAEGNAP